MKGKVSRDVGNRLKRRGRLNATFREGAGAGARVSGARQGRERYALEVVEEDVDAVEVLDGAAGALQLALLHSDDVTDSERVAHAVNRLCKTACAIAASTSAGQKSE